MFYVYLAPRNRLVPFHFDAKLVLVLLVNSSLEIVAKDQILSEKVQAWA